MAAFDTTRAPVASSAFARRLGATFTTTFGALADWNDARLTRKELGSLTDRELDDIGLHRGDIEDVATRGFYRF